MTEKWTPGPWLRDGDLVYALDERNNVNRFAARVEGGYMHHTRHERTRTPAEEIEANAILMTAAPDLYEALADGEELIAGNLVGVEWKQACAAFLDKARVALSRARGE